MNVLRILRSSYFYAALSIAGGAMVAALVALLGLALQLVGLSEAAPTPEAIRETISTSVATLIFAVPIGAVHLWLVRRSLREPVEHGSGPRHLFLNAWIVVGLGVAVMSIDNLARVIFVERTRDVAFPLAALAAAALVVLAAWRWREAYPRARRDWQLVAGFITLLIASALVIGSMFAWVGALFDVFVPDGARGYYEPGDQLRWSTVSLTSALGLWAIGLRWLWRWRDVPFRTYYASAGYLVGIALVAVPGSQTLAYVIGVLHGGVRVAELRGMFELPAIGALFIVLHGLWLRADRGRAGYPAVVTDRIVRGITALGGLAAVGLAATALGSVIVQDLLRIGPAQTDPLRVRYSALGAALIGLALYPVPWRAFVRSTEPRSGLRRTYILLVTGAALLGAIVTGVVAVSTVIQAAMGAVLSDDAIRGTIDAAGWAVVFGLGFAIHVWLLLRDLRAARALAPAEATGRPDPIVDILEEVAAGRVAPRDAATRIHALRSPFHLPGMP